MDINEAAKEYSGKESHPLNNAFIAGAKWQEEQSKCETFDNLEEELKEWMEYGPHTNFPWCTIPDAIEITARHFANWQKEQDKETIELAEDHAMLAGMNKMSEMIKNKIEKRQEYLEEHNFHSMVEELDNLLSML